MTYLFIYFRTTEQANPYFVLQQRRSQEERRSSLASFFVTTIGSVLDNKVIFELDLNVLIFMEILNRIMLIVYFIVDQIQKFIIVSIQDLNKMKLIEIFSDSLG